LTLDVDMPNVAGLFAFGYESQSSAVHGMLANFGTLADPGANPDDPLPYSLGGPHKTVGTLQQFMGGVYENQSYGMVPVKVDGQTVASFCMRNFDRTSPPLVPHRC
jgi:hypothetical protein